MGTISGDDVRHRRMLAELGPLAGAGSAQRELGEEYLRFADDPRTMSRERSPAEHLTASAFVLSPDLDEVLLCFHGKGRFWVQLGGHLEDDPSLRDAALREAAEESGIARLAPLLPGPVDLDRHELSSRFGTCRVHWDVGFALVAERDAALVVSEESESLAWFPLDALPDGLASGLPARLDRLRAALTRAGRHGS